MTHKPDAVARIGGGVIDWILVAVMAACLFVVAKAFVDAVKPDRADVPDYHPSLARPR